MTNTNNDMQSVVSAKRKCDIAISNPKDHLPMKVVKKLEEDVINNFGKNAVGDKEKEKVDLKGKGIIQDKKGKGKMNVEEVDHVDVVNYRDFDFDDDDESDDDSDDSFELWSDDSDWEYFYGEMAMDSRMQNGKEGCKRVEKGIVIVDDPKDRCKNGTDSGRCALMDKKGKNIDL